MRVIIDDFVPMQRSPIITHKHTQGKPGYEATCSLSTHLDLLPDSRLELSLLRHSRDDVHPGGSLAVVRLALQIMLTLNKFPDIKPCLFIYLNRTGNEI